MAVQALRRSDFTETYAVHAAITAALKSKLYANDPDVKSAAEKLRKNLESENTIYGRQCRMIRLMQKGATLAQLCKGLKCSRRTAFRYFLELESAGIDITLTGATYTVSKGLLLLVP